MIENSAFPKENCSTGASYFFLFATVTSHFCARNNSHEKGKQFHSKHVEHIHQTSKEEKKSDDQFIVFS